MRAGSRSSSKTSFEVIARSPPGIGGSSVGWAPTRDQDVSGAHETPGSLHPDRPPRLRSSRARRTARPSSHRAASGTPARVAPPRRRGCPAAASSRTASRLPPSQSPPRPRTRPESGSRRPSASSARSRGSRRCRRRGILPPARLSRRGRRRSGPPGRRRTRLRSRTDRHRSRSSADGPSWSDGHLPRFTSWRQRAGPPEPAGDRLRASVRFTRSGSCSCRLSMPRSPRRVRERCGAPRIRRARRRRRRRLPQPGRSGCPALWR